MLRVNQCCIFWFIYYFYHIHFRKLGYTFTSSVGVSIVGGIGVISGLTQGILLPVYAPIIHVNTHNNSQGIVSHLATQYITESNESSAISESVDVRKDGFIFL